jgi:membrane-associated phospholipid phosphatase
MVEEKNIFIKILDYIGLTGPFLLFIFSIFLLRNKTFLFISYIIGFGLNIIVNFILKDIIQQPRPSQDIKLINIAKNNGKRIGSDKYGMPSGHAQLCFYSVTYIYLVLKNTKITTLYLFISLLTLFQRIKYKNHTFIQVMVGAIVGLLTGYIIYIYTFNLKRGKISLKKDDNAFN